MRTILTYAAVILCNIGIAQPVNDSLLNRLSEKYVAYYNPEKEWIHMQINKSHFLPGEAIWFKAYILNEQTHQPFLGTKNLYVELFDQNNKMVRQQIVYSQSGIAFGQFFLAGDIGSGQYILRAYTSWLKNFGTDSYFTQTLIVAGDNKTAGNSLPASDYDIQFFPEGGELIKDIETRIAFKIIDTKGYGVPLNGVVKENGKVIGQVTSDLSGMGSFKIMPAKDVTATAEFTLPDGRVQIVKLPVPLDKGVGISVTNSGTGELEFNIVTNEEGRKELADKVMYCTIHRQGAMLLFKRAFGESKIMKFSIPKSKLPTGVCNITLFDEELKPIADRAVFISSGEEQLHLEAEAVREKDTLSIRLVTKDAYGKPVPADLSVSILPGNTISDQFGRNILSRYLLESDIKGFIQNPGYYFESNDGEHTSALDNLLLTQGWKNYDWNTIFNGTHSFPFGFELGFDIAGNIPNYKKRNDDILVLSSKTNDLAFPVIPDKAGSFAYRSLYLLDSSKITISVPAVVQKRKFSNLSVTVSQPLFDTSFMPARALLPVNLLHTDPMGNLLADAKYHLLEEVKVSTIVNTKPKVVFDDPYTNPFDRVFTVDTKIINQYSTLLDLLRSRFNITVKGYDSLHELVVDMHTAPISIMLAAKPVLVIDGISTSMNMLENIPLQNVEAIIVNKSPDPMFGARGAAGSIRIQTRKGVNVYDDNESSLLKEIIVRGYSAAVKFYSPKYNAEPSDPRYISYVALHWVPDIMTDSTGKAAFKFYLPAEIKEVKIRAEGIDNSGKLLFYNRKTLL